MVNINPDTEPLGADNSGPVPPEKPEKSGDSKKSKEASK